MMRWYDRDGHPHEDETELERLRDDDAYRVVDRTKVMDACDLAMSWDVSTVWLGLERNMDATGSPLIFETMVFAEGVSLDATCRRYSTLAEAERGHHELTTTVAATLTHPVVLDWSPATSPAPEA